LFEECQDAAELILESAEAKIDARLSTDVCLLMAAECRKWPMSEPSRIRHWRKWSAAALRRAAEIEPYPGGERTMAALQELARVEKADHASEPRHTSAREEALSRAQLVFGESAALVPFLILAADSLEVEQGRERLRRAVALLQAEFGATHTRLIAPLSDLALLLWFARDFEGSVEAARRAGLIAQRRSSLEAQFMFSLVADNMTMMGRYQEALSIRDQLVFENERCVSDTGEDVLASLLYAQADAQRRVGHRGVAVDTLERAGALPPPLRGDLCELIAVLVLRDAGRQSEAIALAKSLSERGELLKPTRDPLVKDCITEVLELLGASQR
jgi:hypothetical protein